MLISSLGSILGTLSSLGPIHLICFNLEPTSKTGEQLSEKLTDSPFGPMLQAFCRLARLSMAGTFQAPHNARLV